MERRDKGIDPESYQHHESWQNLRNLFSINIAPIIKPYDQDHALEMITSRVMVDIQQATRIATSGNLSKISIMPLPWSHSSPRLHWRKYPLQDGPPSQDQQLPIDLGC